jgi:Ig-like domain CHU_C associated/Secretion system C-terminal sorting domain
MRPLIRTSFLGIILFCFLDIQKISAQTPAPCSVQAASNRTCTGGRLQLEARLPSGVAATGLQFSWTGPNAFMSTLQNPVIEGATPNQNGSYQVTMQTSSGCTATANAVVQIGPPLSVTPTVPEKVCVGTTFPMGVNAQPTGTGIFWSGPNGFSSTQQNPSISSATTAASGVYSVSVISFESFCSATATASVSVVTCTSTVACSVSVTASAPSSTVCAGTALNLSARAEGATFAWSGPNGFSSTLANPSIAASATANAGIYTVRVVKIQGGCSASTTVGVAVQVCNVPTSTCTVQVSSNGPVCAGSRLLLGVGTGGLSRVWSGPQGFTSTSQYPSITTATLANGGVYTVRVVRSATCTATSTINVVVNTCPVTCTIAMTAASNRPLCVGNTLYLNANTGSTTSTSGLTFSWVGPNGFRSSTKNPVLSRVGVENSGIYTVSVLSTRGCTGAATVQVNVGTLPTVTVSPTAVVCAGSNASLTASGGASYQWTGPSNFFSTQQNPSISNATTSRTGIYAVRVTSSLGCSVVATTALRVSNGTSVQATNSGAVCIGSTARLNALTEATSFAWAGPGGFVSTVKSPNITNMAAAKAGIYSVTVTNAGGCTSTATTRVEVISTLVNVRAESNGEICLGSTIRLNASGGAMYVWSGPNGFTSVNKSPSISRASAEMSGIYTVNILSNASCSATATVAVQVQAAPSTPVIEVSEAEVCIGSLVEFSAVPPVGGTIRWQDEEGELLETGNTLRIEANTVGAMKFYATAVTAQGCRSARQMASVQVLNCCGAMEAEAFCAPGIEGYTILFKVTNNSGRTIHQVGLYPPKQTGLLFSNTIFDKTLEPGDSYTGTFTITGSAVPNLRTLCLRVGMFEIENEEVVWNCETEPICLVIPNCEEAECDLDLSITADTTICAGTSVPLKAMAHSGSVKYAWTPAAGLSHTDKAEVTATPTATTIYKVVVTDTLTGCVDSLDVTVTVQNCQSNNGNNSMRLSMDAPKAQREIAPIEATLSLFPNPVINEVVIELPEGRWKSAQVFQISGLKVADKTLDENTRVLRFEMSRQPAGTYVVEVQDTQGRRLTKKFLKQP